MNLGADDVQAVVPGASKAAAVYYPIEMVRALAHLWLSGALRSDEIHRPPIGCIRWQRDDGRASQFSSNLSARCPGQQDGDRFHQRFYDLGHGFCTYDFFDQCPHRMACAKCAFYVPKESTRAQAVEAKVNLMRMLQEFPLLEEERAAVEDGVAAMTKLMNGLHDVVTPDGHTPAEIAVSLRGDASHPTKKQWAATDDPNVAADRGDSCGRLSSFGLWPGGHFPAGAVFDAIEICGVLASREPVEKRPLGGRDQILDHFGYCVTVMTGEASELRLGLNTDEELDALLGAVEAEMTFTVALLLLGGGEKGGQFVTARRLRERLSPARRGGHRHGFGSEDNIERVARHRLQQVGAQAIQCPG